MNITDFTMDFFSLQGKKAIVTGGNTGLGQAFTLALAKAGADVFVPSMMDDDGSNAMSMGEDCGYCVTHAGSFGMPPSTVSGLPFAAQSQLHPFLFYRAPQPLAAWSASRPRGPPAHV